MAGISHCRASKAVTAMTPIASDQLESRGHHSNAATAAVTQTNR